MKAIPGQKVKETLFIHLCSWSETGVNLFASDMSKSSSASIPYICIGTVNVEFEIPEYDGVKLQVESLENHLQELNAKHHIETQNIKDQIQRLTAIGHDKN